MMTTTPIATQQQKLRQTTPLLMGSEMAGSLQRPQPGTVELQDDNDHKRGGHDGGLDAKLLLRPHRLGPGDLDIPDDETANGSARVQPRRHLAGCFWVRVQRVGVDGGRDDDDGEVVEEPADGEDHIVISML